MLSQFQKIFACLFLLSLMVSCNNKKRLNQSPESISSFIYAYTSGEISKAAPIRVRFTNALINREQIGTKVEENIIEFEPRIKGEAIWEDDRTIYFKPSEYLPAKEEYIATINLKKLYKDVPQDATVFEFGFQVKEQNFYLRFNGLRAEDPEDAKVQRLEGYVYTNDLAEDTEVEKLIKATFTQKQLKIRWEHSSDKLRHDFYVEGIVRDKEDAEMLVEWNGKPMGVNNKGDKSFVIPGVNNFQVMDAKVVQGGDQHVLIFFSDPLLKSQPLEGLISISGYSGQLRFTIDGNQLFIYTDGQLNGERTVTIEAGLKNTFKVATKNKIEWKLLFEEPKPALRLVGNGVILPKSDGLYFPFEAINLNAVDIEVFKIYNNNILQYLQFNQIDEYYQLEEVGRIVLQKQISLKDISPNANSDIWARYALDLAQLMDQDPNSIYQIRLGFRPEYTSYKCNNANNDETDNLQVYENPFDEDGEIQSIWDYNYYGIEGYYDGFSYEQREDPCFPAYYNTDNFIRRNVLASNLGIVAKSAGDSEMQFFVTDLRTTKSLASIKLDIYDYQQQIISTVTTDGNGMAKVDLKTKPFVVVANRGEERGYLKLLDPNALSLSKFDVAGSIAQKGIKGFIYGERGVWRPGDSLYLNFVLEDKTGKLPKNHPITFELYDARNQLQQKFTTSENVNNVYPLAISTAAEAETGNWRATVQLGGATFSKTLKIETVKPNRLKIKLDFGKEELTSADMPMDTKLQINWLHGAPARNLKAKVEMQLRSVNTTFPKYDEYQFDDPARRVSDDYKSIFDGSVNDEGEASVKTDFSGNKNLPGKMKSDFRIRAFESGGGSSEDNFSVIYHPFGSYAGVSIPRNRYGSKQIDVEKGGRVNFVAVNTKGEPLKNRKLKIGLYRSEWRWWWEEDDANIGLYNTSSHYNALDSFSVSTDNTGAASWNLKVGGWGRYLVRVCDQESGHCSGDFFYAGYPWWGEDDDNSQQREAAAMLMFSSDKKKYNVGETVELRIPSSKGGRALITIESGSKVLSSQWLDTQAEETVFTFKTFSEMAPTVYAHVSMIQPHGQTQNDLPIRMYGVIPINVEDPGTRLKPVIKMADVLKPEEKVKIEIKEESGHPMAYTIAVVDDGLLDLTRFKTPNPWDIFYAREALGVKTWDVYDHVLGAYGGQLERVLSIGGDGDAGADKGKPKANRFKPVVQHFGPFYLKKGGKAEHEFIMPNYVGSVRTMVVASDNGAYGSAEKTTPVRKPLMVLATLPRVIGPGESLKVPVNVFAMEDKVKNVTVKIEESTGLIKISGGSTKQVSFSRTGDQLVDFEINIPEKTGIAKFIITATGSGEKATQEIEIDIRNPNPYISDIYAGVLQKGEIWDKEFSLPGVEGTNSITLEVANVPPINLGKRLHYLIQYPHGCVEQTISSAFPQLYVGEIIEINDLQKKEIAFNIKAAIEKLKSFQNHGGFSYWPGDNEDNSWASTYGGHFLLEAKNLGYYVPDIMISKWTKYQQDRAKNWTESVDERGYYGSNHKLMQAYRLYTLALAGAPEFGAMNRLRESRNLPSTAMWRLAAAYALAGKPEVGNQMVSNLTTVVEDYTELSYTYGSELRDQAMILEALILMKNNKGAAEMVVEISKSLGSEDWYNTQAISYSLLAFGKFMKENDLSDQLKFAYQINGGKVIDAGSQKSIMHIDIPAKSMGAKRVSVTNKNGGIIYARLIVNGQPVVGDQTEASNHLAINVVYKNVDGKTINPDKIPQGTDFVAEVSVTNSGTKGRYYKEMALSQIFPSGWEITNTRMTDVIVFQNTNTPTYQDIRDDRVYSYFDIGAKQSQIYRVQLNAAYQGKYYLPSISCEAMYDHTINARKKGQWVEVVPADATIASN